MLLGFGVPESSGLQRVQARGCRPVPQSGALRHSQVSSLRGIKLGWILYSRKRLVSEHLGQTNGGLPPHQSFYA